jgi:hypothetical protein
VTVASLDDGAQGREAKAVAGKKEARRSLESIALEHRLKWPAT